LAGAASCPQAGGRGDACELKGETPSSDACEKVTLGIVSEIIGGYFGNGSGIYVTFRDETFCYEGAEPLGCSGVDFVVVVHFGNYIHVP
jgi:hypothetical protein